VSIVINETMARFYFAKDDPLGKYLIAAGRAIGLPVAVGAARVNPIAALRQQ